MTGGRRYSKKRLKTLILYILGNEKFKHASALDDFLKLANMLYLCDMESFGETGKSITGATYIKVSAGVMPTKFAEVLDEMIADGDIKITKKKGGKK